MPRKSSTFVSALPHLQDFRRELRPGQTDLYRSLKTESVPGSVNIQWPGGYGKSLGMALAFRAMIERSEVDRLLVVVANTTQLDQILNDFKSDCADAGVMLNSSPWKFTREPSTIRANFDGRYHVFATTIQSVSATARNEIDALMMLLRSGGKWMLAADEYHHYADGKDWGKSLQRIVDEVRFSIATSATPSRDEVPTIFGEPDMSVSYADAVKTNCVKDLQLVTYEYGVDATSPAEKLIYYTTSELRDECKEAADINKLEHQHLLRYLTKYVHPLLHRPLGRLLATSVGSRHRLQMLVRAMSCRHAEAVSGQLSRLTGLSVDWIGTGDDGRPQNENTAIKELFCPPKNSLGVRPEPKLDILVQVAMAGEGFDSINVIEVVDLSIVSLEGTANMTKQFYLRGSRVIAGEDHVLHVSVPTDHPLSECDDVIQWLDGKYVKRTAKKERVDKEHEWRDIPTLPDKLREPKIDDVNFLEMTFMSPEAQAIAAVAKVDYSDVNFTESDLVDLARRAYSAQQQSEHEKFSLSFLKGSLDGAISTIVNLCIRRDEVFEQSKLGDYKKRIMGRLKKQFGPRDSLLHDELHAEYDWIKTLELSIRDGDRPAWLR